MQRRWRYAGCSASPSCYGRTASSCARGRCCYGRTRAKSARARAGGTGCAPSGSPTRGAATSGSAPYAAPATPPLPSTPPLP
eukprot:9500497-Pyramimonas_sp.AAC.1